MEEFIQIKKIKERASLVKVDAFKAFKSVGLRYRRELKNFVENNLQSHKSRTSVYNFV